MFFHQKVCVAPSIISSINNGQPPGMKQAQLWALGTMTPKQSKTKHTNNSKPTCPYPPGMYSKIGNVVIKQIILQMNVI